MKTFLRTLAILLGLIGTSQVCAEENKEIVLTVTASGKSVEFDLETLKEMEPVSFTTSTIWTTEQQEFTGVSLSGLMEALEVKSGTIIATAINDYAVEIPVMDAVIGGPIIAYLQNSEPMSVRDKGPLWIVYPYDSHSKYQSEIIYSRSIWQLNHIDVKN